MKTFILATESGFAAQTNQFCQNIDGLIKPLSLDPAEVAAFKVTNTFVQFIFGEQAGIQSFAKAFTDYKNILHFGPSNALMGDIPLPPVFPSVLPVISMGNARSQFADLIQNCVRSKNFTSTMGITLGFVKAETEEKAEEGTPNLTIKLTTGGHPLLHATKGIYQGYEVWKDINDGKGYSRLATSLYADYIDLSTLPAVGIGVTWKYKVIYILKGVECGNWSAEVTIGVFGLI